MKLNDPLVTTIEFKGIEYPLDLSFDNVLDVLEIINERFLENDTAELCLDFLIGDNDLNVMDQLDLFTEIVMNHINLRDNFVELDLEGKPMPVKNSDAVIDFDQDAKFIYASFRQIGINLYEEQGKLQWVEFQSLLEALPDDCILSKIIRYRTYEPSRHESADYKSEMRKLKSKYSLKKVGDTNG